ncbi:MAG: LLM class flavin-dependent oxidoreductase [Ilumatobacter sp.]|uniref:LLM class flavin-dependent oxidoreductase n=1 Tax=Ilumatobacter sp. TaxID=1967498 RepID=UPI002613A372|nr:LLM class flavin-dependent oxidoreductase [Ilumatobacter sp.]MDJ0770744.1 LLM class flavin-dependent oxidoreductase [Ilumatobacter sp.]
MQVGVSASGLTEDDVTFVVEAERLGATSVWVPEAWGYDALTPLAYLAARTSTIRLATGIVQVGARSPAMLSMQAMSVQAMSGGRLLLGLGSSGPRVMEGWHGVPFERPLAAMRDTIDIVRKVAAGERLVHDGRAYRLPLHGEGRGIRSMAPPTEPPIPMFIASLGPKSLELTGEIADGWLGNAFMAEHADVFLDAIRAGCVRGGRTIDELELVMPVAVEFTPDEASGEAAGRRHADGYAFTIGAMGTADQNFYNRAFTEQGYGDDVAAVYDLWQAGRREEAAARVPFDIGFKTNLLGTPDMVAKRVRRYRDAGIETLQAKVGGPLQERIDTVAQLVEIVHEVSAEPTS